MCVQFDLDPLAADVRAAYDEYSVDRLEKMCVQERGHAEYHRRQRWQLIRMTAASRKRAASGEGMLKMGCAL